MRIGPIVAALLLPATASAAASAATTLIDNAGDVWIAGQTNLSLQTTANAYQPSAVFNVCGSQNVSPFQPPMPLYCGHAYLQRQDPTGKLLYATYLGGSSQDGATVLATDAAGNIYVAGYTYSADFPVTAGAIQSKNAGPTTPTVFTALGAPYGPAYVVNGGDVFVSKFSASGTLLFSTLLGGSASDVPLLLDVDSSGAIYIAGVTQSTDFPLTPNAMTSQHSGYFFTKLNSTGTTLLYSTYSTPSILAFNVDSAGRAYLTGDAGKGQPYLTIVDTSSGAVVGTRQISSAGSAGVAIAATPRNLFLALSPAPLPYNFLFYPSTPAHTLGASSFLTMTADGATVLSTTAVSQSTFDSILTDAAGDGYAFGHGNGAIPATMPQLLSTPCSENPTSFVIEANSAGSVVAATYFRQGDDTAVTLTAPGHMELYRSTSSTTVPLDLTALPATWFGCPMNLASGAIGIGLAPGEIILITGTGLGPAQGIGAVPTSGFYPTSLAGVQVFSGSTPLPLLYVQANEIHAVNTFSPASTNAIQVQYGSLSSVGLDVARADQNPGIFSVNGQGAIVNQDGTVNTPSNPAPLGSIVSVYCTGTGYPENPIPDGEVTPLAPLDTTELQSPAVTFAGIAGKTLWSGLAPGLISGVTQINVQLPATLPAGTNLAAVPVILNTGGNPSPPVFISLHQ